MRWVADSSCLISLARSGLLHLVPRLPVDLVLLDVVWREVVEQGTSAGHPDALAVAATFEGCGRQVAEAGSTVDASVLAAAVRFGGLVANDLALGRRARNVGIHWLRTGDLVVAAAQRSEIARPEARAGIVALRDSGRITVALAEQYLEELT